MPAPHDYEELKRAAREVVEPVAQPVAEPSSSPALVPVAAPASHDPVLKEKAPRAVPSKDQEPVTRENIRGPGNPPLLREDNAKMVEENARLQFIEARQKHADKVEAMSQEHATMLAEQAREMGSVRDRFTTLNQDAFAKENAFVPDANKFAHEKARFEKTLAEQSGGDPYEAQARAAASEHAMFMREQRQYEERIANEPDLTKRNDLTMQQEIRAADHLAYTSHRIADQSETLTGVKDNPTAEHYRERATEQEQLSSDTRKRYQSRGGGKDFADQQKENRASYERSAESAQRARSDGAKKAPAAQKSYEGVGELSDRQQERLGRLSEQFSETSAETTHGKGPTKPNGRGGAD